MTETHPSIRPVVALLLLSLFGPTPARAETLPPLFNGKDLAGWKVPDNNPWWTVKDGVLYAASGPKKQGSVLWTETQYRNFVMQLEFLFGPGTVDSGVFIRNESQQVQIGVSGLLKRDMTGSPYIAAEKGYPVEATGVAELLKPEAWNRMTIVAMGPHYAVWLNGVPVLNYRSASAVELGPIGLQLHPDREMSIQFRNIRLAELR